MAKRQRTAKESATVPPSEKLAAIVEQLDAFEDEYLCLDMSDVQQAAADLEGFSESLAGEGL